MKRNKIHMLLIGICKNFSLRIENIFNVKGAHMKESKIHKLYRKIVIYTNNP